MGLLLKILFNTYSIAFQNPGGGEAIILKLKKALENRGHQVELYNKWEHKIKDFDLIHEFSLLEWQNWNHFKYLNKPLVLTPTAWPRNGFLDILKMRIKSILKQTLQSSSPPYSLYHYLKLPDVICPTTSLRRSETLSTFFNCDNIFSKYLAP